MKFIKTLLIFIPLFLFLMIPITSFAKDTDLYIAGGEGVEPNILILFDNSGSMNETVQTRFYNTTVTYDPLVVPIEDRDKVYRRRTWGGWELFTNSIGEVACQNARVALTDSGHYEGYTSASCNSTYRILRTGNYRNYIASGGDQYEKKIDIAKQVMTDFLNTINGVRIGAMLFNYSEGGYVQSTIKSLTPDNRSQLISDFNSITPSTWTPLAETLYEAGLYYKGGPSYFNSGVVYTSPIQFYCQRNYIIVITDGKPTQDRNNILPTVIGDRDGDQREPIGAPNDPNYPDNGSDYLDDVAKYLYDTDLRTDLTGIQNIVTYTIGFTINSDILERSAALGHGRYYYCNNAQELSNAFQNIVAEIIEKTSSFVAPIVPVSRMERTTAGDKIYLALFQPKQNSMWSGNIKKFGVSQQNAGNIYIGDILDKNNLPALDDQGQILETAYSYWTTLGMDGSDVEKGGVGEVLMRRSTARNIYTYLGNVNLTNSSNAFNNTNITPTMLGLSAGDTSGRDKLVQFVQGYDAYDDDSNGNVNEKREWLLGSFLHSRPLLIHYSPQPDSISVIYAGANDGMLHAFRDNDGEELWAFIPPDLLNKLQALRADVVESFIDGSPKAYITYKDDGSVDQAILIFGERRGGNRYWAIDVSDPYNPKLKWQINPDELNSSYAEIGATDPVTARKGQTWSSPNIGKIAYGSGEKWVAFIGGGYDDNQDNEIPGADSRGRAVYVVDILDGSPVKRFSFTENNSMTYCIPSDIAAVDINGDGRIDRLYVGDMGGRMWRFNINDSNPDNWSGRIIFESNPGKDNTTGRKIFYPPDVTLEKDVGGNYEMLFFGTGDREHPKEGTVINRIYAIKDKGSAQVLTENSLYDVTSDELQDSGTTQARKNEIITQLRSADGWFIKLELNVGEKSLAPPVIFFKTAYFTTFTPSSEGMEGDPCYVGEGIARLYALVYTTGNAVFNLDLTNDVGGTVVKREDRSKIIGTAIPSGVIITFIQGTAVAYVGMGGGVVKPQLINTKSLFSINWKVVF